MSFHPPKPVSMTLNLAPMVDVIMCLIIFFLLASEMVEKESLAEIKLPAAIAAKQVEGKELGSRVTINVRATGAGPNVDAEYVVVDWNGDAITERVLKPEELEGLLRSRAATSKEKLRCVIRADKDAQYQHIENVLRACGKAKIADIVFPAIRGTEPEASTP